MRKSKSVPPPPPVRPGTPVLISTLHRGVFFGYVNPLDLTADKSTLTVSWLRNCLYWSEEMRGFVGLAVIGPNAKCRIGPAVEFAIVRDVTMIAQCTPEATAAWESAPWAS